MPSRGRSRQTVQRRAPSDGKGFQFQVGHAHGQVGVVLSSDAARREVVSCRGGLLESLEFARGQRLPSGLTKNQKCGLKTRMSIKKHFTKCGEGPFPNTSHQVLPKVTQYYSCTSTSVRMFATTVDPLIAALTRAVRADRPATVFMRADFAAV